jgi:hypothetical protein
VLTATAIVAALVLPTFVVLAGRRAKQREFERTDSRLDKTLKDTFPASDPPAPHFVDIPVNRQ